MDSVFDPTQKLPPPNPSPKAHRIEVQLPCVIGGSLVLTAESKT